jgi:hypothetical protein
MPKRDADTPEIQWESAEEDADDGGETTASGKENAVRLGFHLQAARKIEEARERRQLRKAIEDFDDYIV